MGSGAVSRGTKTIGLVVTLLLLFAGPAAAAPEPAEALAARGILLYRGGDLAGAVPLEMCAVAGEALTAMEELAPLAGRFLLSDLEAAAVLAEAAVRCARCTVRTNAANLQDRATADRTRHALREMEQRACHRLQAIRQAIAARTESFSTPGR